MSEAERGWHVHADPATETDGIAVWRDGSCGACEAAEHHGIDWIVIPVVVVAADLLASRDVLLSEQSAAIARVEELHRETKVTVAYSGGRPTKTIRCACCNEPWPCSTRAALSPCGCWKCLEVRGERIWWMVLCATCGNKRCPHAADHALDCTGSNDTGQPGSAYEHGSGVASARRADAALRSDPDEASTDA